MEVNNIIERLREFGNPETILFKQKKFGIVSNNSLGVFQKELNLLAKEIGKNSSLAEELFDTGIYDARILCSKIFKPKDLNKSLVKKWSAKFDNWEICDSFSMGVYAKSPIANWIIDTYKVKESIFEKRTAFAAMAGYCSSNKIAHNEVFISFFDDIINASNDDRLYVKKSVNWALRSIGKRNSDLNKRALNVSVELINSENKTAKWIGRDAFRELANPNVRISDYPRDIYRS